MSQIFLSITVWCRSFLIICVVCAWFLIVAPAQAQIPAGGLELDGYAWSSNIGWISLNCRSGGALRQNVCGTSDYKVRITQTGQLTGHAWSPHIGWIQFGGLSTFPAGGGTTAQNANVTGTYTPSAVNLQANGWARACSATVGWNCSSMATAPTAGGWDGWISLRGTASTPPNPAYGVGLASSGQMAPNSFAWGGAVVGWIDMNSSGSLPGRVSWLDPNTPNTISISSCNVPLGASNCSENLVWSTIVPIPSIQELSPNPGQVSTAASGVQSITMVPGSTYQYEIYSNGSPLTPPVMAIASVQCVPNAIYSGGVCIANNSTLTLGTCSVALGDNSCNATVDWDISPAITTPSVARITPSSLPFTRATRTGSETVPFATGLNTFEIRSNGSALIPPVRQSVTITCSDPNATAANPGQPCQCNAGSVPVAGVCTMVTPPVINSFSVSPNFIRRGGTVMLNYQFGAPLTPADNCTITGGGLAQSLTTQSGTVGPTNPLLSYTRFVLQCTGHYGTVERATFVEVAPSFIEI